jgi:hypothetical protein
MENSDDLSSDYSTKVAQTGQSHDVAEMEQFLTQARSPEGAPAPSAPGSDVVGGDAGRPLPQGKPIRAMTGDPLGRIMMGDQKPKNTPAANIREIPGSVAGGVESAIHNAMGWAIDPLANWLNENVADLSYTRKDPDTATGKIVKSVTEFLTGFIPAIKGVKALGVVNPIVAPMAAGALADFAVRDPAAGRLADIWKQLGLQENILTDFLASKPTDTETESRLKNALEGTGLGVLTEGVFMGARMIRAAKNIRGAKQAETDYLKDRYGTFDDETYGKIIGDPSKPSVEMVVHEPPKVGAKIAKGAEDTKNIDPRSVIEVKPRVASASEISDAAKTQGMSRRDFLKAAGATAAQQIIPGAKLIADLAKGDTSTIVGAGKYLHMERFFDYGGHGEFYGFGEAASKIPGFLERWKKAGLTEEQLHSDRPDEIVKFLETHYPKDYDFSNVSRITEADLDTHGGSYNSKIWKVGDINDMEGAVNFQDVLDGEAKRAGMKLLEPEEFANRWEQFLKKPLFREHVANTLGLKPSEVNKMIKDGGPMDLLDHAAEGSKDGLAISEKFAHDMDNWPAIQTAMRIAKKEVKESAMTAAEAQTAANQQRRVYINFGRFDEPDEVKTALDNMAQAAAPSIDEATRGVITHVETQKLADDLGMTVTDLLQRMHGQPLNAEEAVAARQLWAASAEKLVELAKVAGAKNAGPLDQFAFRKQMAVHAAIQSEIIGARTETARALGAWKIPVKGGTARARASTRSCKPWVARSNRARWLAVWRSLPRPTRTLPPSPSSCARARRQHHRRRSRKRGSTASCPRRRRTR